jgi:hypothetical protein
MGSVSLRGHEPGGGEREGTPLAQRPEAATPRAFSVLCTMRMTVIQRNNGQFPRKTSGNWTKALGIGVAEGVIVMVGVKVAVGELVGELVTVMVWVAVGVSVLVMVSVWVPVAVLVGVEVLVAVRVVVYEAVAVRVSVLVRVAVRVAVG